MFELFFFHMYDISFTFTSYLYIFYLPEQKTGYSRGSLFASRLANKRESAGRGKGGQGSFPWESFSVSSLRALIPSVVN